MLGGGSPLLPFQRDFGKIPMLCNVLRLIHLHIGVGTKPYLKVTPPYTPPP